MAKVDLYNVKGEKTGQIDLNDAVFGVKVKESVVHQVYSALMANARQPWAHSKDRGEIRGGGRKPWKQKGTGRARHGSTRSPLWRGGGVTFGPLNIRNYQQKVNKKTNKLASKMVLSDKVGNAQLIVVDALPSDAKTKTFFALRENLPGKGKTTLFLLEDNNETVRRAANNLPKTDIGMAKDVSIVDLLHHQFVFTTKGAVEVLEKRLA